MYLAQLLGAVSFHTLYIWSRYTDIYSRYKVFDSVSLLDSLYITDGFIDVHPVHHDSYEQFYFFLFRSHINLLWYFLIFIN